MAEKSRCPGCGKSPGFEAVRAEVDGTPVSLLFIRCRGCRVVIGTCNPYDHCDFNPEHWEAEFRKLP